jgi:two-component system OmpR family response regulator
MSVCIGLVEDDGIIRENYKELLERQHYRVDAHADRGQALAAFGRRLPDLAILDVALGGEHDGGYQLCLELRRMSVGLPILFLTAHDGEADRISGLRMGADDYLSKTTSFDYLLVRVETLLRRSAQLRGEARAEASLLRPQLPGPPEIDAVRCVIHWQGRRVELSLTQFWIAESLLAQPGMVRSHDDLMRAAKIHVEPNTIAAHIRNIREAFRAVDASFDAIRAERGLGYRWVPD